MKITEANIAKVLDYLCLDRKYKGFQYLIDLLIEREFQSDKDTGELTSDYSTVIRDTAYTIGIAIHTLRSGISKLLVKMSEVPLDSNRQLISTDKRVFITMLSRVQLSSQIEILYTLMKMTQEADYE